MTVRRALLLTALIACIASAVFVGILEVGSRRDPRPHRVAIELASQVKSGTLDDCEALARFIEACTRPGDAESSNAVLAAVNEFIPRGKANYPLGIPIGLIGAEHPVKLEGKQSGYRVEFRKGYGPGSPEGLPHDQAHHFAPYLILGATVPDFITGPFLDLAERPESWGDINLARKALAFGRMLRDQEIAVADLPGLVRAESCASPM